MLTGLTNIYADEHTDECINSNKYIHCSTDKHINITDYITDYTETVVAEDVNILQMLENPKN